MPRSITRRSVAQLEHLTCSALTRNGSRCRMAPCYSLADWPVCYIHTPATGSSVTLAPDARQLGSRPVVTG